MIEVRDLRLVQAIDQHGSLIRAARVLGTGQPALTRRLAALEARMRGRLFERGPRGVIATDLGRAILAEADEILGRLARLDRYTAEVRGDQVRDLSVVAGAYAAELICLVAAARMLACHPQIRVRLASTNWTEVPRALIDREASLGVLDLSSYSEDPGLTVEPLRPQPGVFVARPGHPLAARRSLELCDILTFPMVFIGNAPAHVQAPMAAAREEARLRGAMHPAFPAMVHESPTISLGALRHSDAVAAVTLAIAGPALRAGQVAVLPWRAPWVSVHPGVLHLRGRPLGEAEQAFVELLRAADEQGERDALALCEELGLPPDCA